MACFLVPAAEAVVTTVLSRTLNSKADKQGIEAHPVISKMKWLNSMLWGGSALLAFEHLWHGEIVPWFPFLTAAGNPEDMAGVLHEMCTVGVTMAVMVTAVWGGMVFITSIAEKKASKTQAADSAGGAR